MAKSILEVLGTISTKDLKIRLNIEEKIQLIRAVADEKIDQIRDFSLGGGQPKLTDEQKLKIEIIEMERDIKIIKLRLEKAKNNLNKLVK